MTPIVDAKAKHMPSNHGFWLIHPYTIKNFIFWLIYFCIVTLSTVVVAEIILRFLPVTNNAHFMEVNNTSPLIRLHPNKDFTYSKYWNFSIINHGHINNYGFVNNKDYVRNYNGNLMAVIGDSYVEALMIPYEQTIQGRLEKIVRNFGHVYSFGISGAHLAQYLMFAHYAISEFHPDSLVFIIVGNDFDESLSKYQNYPGFYSFQEDSKHNLTLMKVDYKPGLLKRLLRHFAIARYVRHNLGVGSIIGAIQSRGKDKYLYVGNTSSEANEIRLNDSKRAVEIFFSELSKLSSINKSKILFVIDGARPHIYSNEELASVKGSYFEIMRDYFMENCLKENYEYIDMQEIFVARHSQDGSRFEFPTDGHWNSLGHELAARAIASSRVFKSTF
jgi:hypothetical protein